MVLIEEVFETDNVELLGESLLIDVDHLHGNFNKYYTICWD